MTATITLTAVAAVAAVAVGATLALATDALTKTAAAAAGVFGGFAVAFAIRSATPLATDAYALAVGFAIFASAVAGVSGATLTAAAMIRRLRAAAARRWLRRYGDSLDASGDRSASRDAGYIWAVAGNRPPVGWLYTEALAIAERRGSADVATAIAAVAAAEHCDRAADAKRLADRIAASDRWRRLAVGLATFAASRSVDLRRLAADRASNRAAGPIAVAMAWQRIASGKATAADRSEAVADAKRSGSADLIRAAGS